MINKNIQQSSSTNKNKIKDLNLFIGSWNVGGQDFPNNFSLIPWLYPKESQTISDIYVLGFQEIINLSAKNILISSNLDKVESLRLTI